MNPTTTVAYVLLFAATAFVFVFAALVLGRFLRPAVPAPAKREIYECGEEAVGSSFVQFDLRFYVVALLFIVLDVEAAFFFPWAVVYGKAVRLSDPPAAAAIAEELSQPSVAGPQGRAAVPPRLAELGVRDATPPAAEPGVPTAVAVTQRFRDLAWLAMLDIVVFFGVVLVGFAYLWKRGDLDWVRAIGRPVDAEEIHEVQPAAVASTQGIRPATVAST